MILGCYAIDIGLMHIYFRMGKQQDNVCFITCMHRQDQGRIAGMILHIRIRSSGKGILDFTRPSLDNAPKKKMRRCPIVFLVKDGAGPLKMRPRLGSSGSGNNRFECQDITVVVNDG